MKVAAVIGVVIVVLVFFFAPVVYSPIRAWARNGGNCGGAMCPISIAAYESPGCALFGVGAGVVNQTYAQVLVTEFGDQVGGTVGPWSSYLGCPPSYFPPPPH